MLEQESQTNIQVRLDKYLWACRFYKTRSISRQMIEGGKVDYNGHKAKASKIVELGAKISLLFGHDRIEIIVKQISDIRGPYSVAKELYEQTPESILKIAKQKQIQQIANNMITPPNTKPNKKQRRDLQKFIQINYT